MLGILDLAVSPDVVISVKFRKLHMIFYTWIKPPAVEILFKYYNVI